MGVICLLFTSILLSGIDCLNADRSIKISNPSIKHNPTLSSNTKVYPVSKRTNDYNDIKKSIKTRTIGTILPINTLTQSASKYINSLKILLSNPIFPIPSSSDIRMIFLRGLIVPVFISSILLSNTFYNYLEENWAFQGYWNGLSTKELTTIALTIHLIHSLFKLFILRGFFIANLTSIRCPIKEYFNPTKKSLLTRIMLWNPKFVTNFMGTLSVGITALSLYVGIILAETGWGTAHPTFKGGEAIAYAVTIVSMFKSIFLKPDFPSLVNINHFMAPITFRNDFKKSYALSNLFKTTAELPEEYKSVMLSQSQMKLISFLAVVAPFTSYVLKIFPTCLETFSMLLLLSINLNNLSLAGIFTSLIHATSLLIENIIYKYDRQLLIKDIDTTYNK